MTTPNGSRPNYISPHSADKKLDTMGHIYAEEVTYNFYYQLWSVVGASWYIFNFSERQHSINYFAKYDMFSVQEIALRSGNKELISELRINMRLGKTSHLTPIRVLSGISLRGRYKELYSAKVDINLPLTEVQDQYVFLGNFRPIFQRR